ncbi:MAG: hypothetical protein ABJA98_06065 [Acidobacteriota bacterium]
MENLATTNVLLGIMAAVSLLEALVIVGVGVAAWKVYRRVGELMAGVERRHVEPAMARVNAILDDVKAVSETVKAETERVDHAIHRTIDRVDDTAERVKRGVRAGASPVVGFVRGLRTAIETFARLRQKAATDRTPRGFDGM